MNRAASRTRIAVITLALAIATSSCTLTALLVGSIVTLARGGKHNKARVRLNRSPEQLLATLETLRPELREGQIDRVKRTRRGARIEASMPRRGAELTIEIRRVDANLSDVTVIADAGTAMMTDHELAVRVLEMICRKTAASCHRQELRHERSERRRAQRHRPGEETSDE